MNIKYRKLFLSVIAVSIFWVLGTAKASAASYYVRLDGGNALECSGTVDAPYSGSGSGQACAFNHPRYALGWGCTNTGNTCANPGIMQSGDTLYIDGDDPTNNGAQAQYEIGYDDTNNNLTPGCSTSYPYDCTLGNIPAGINASQRTSIIGTGTHKPQLWGTQRVWQVLTASNNHIWLQSLEITDHANCAYNSPDQGCNYGGPYPYGPWAEDGVFIGGDDVNLTDVYIHGVARYGVNTDNLGSATFTRFGVVGNGYGGFTTGINATVSGTLTFNQPLIEWNGCVESYPLNSTSSIDHPSNFSNCFGQDQSGYGDGLAFGNVGHGGAGNWNIYGPGSISFNTQDGLDTLHGLGTGTIQIDKMRFEGNAGNQVKMNALTSSLTNSIIIADCGWWLGAPQSSPGFVYGDICRALGDAVLFNVTNNSQTFLYNNTILSNGNVTLESEDLNATGCNNSTSINVKNNIILGGFAWFDDTSFNSAGGNAQTSYLYNDGNNGDGAGTCGQLSWNEDYNLVFGTKNNNRGCNGAHDFCGTDPGFANTIPMGSSGGAVNTYYQGNSAASLVSLNNNSPAIASGNPGLTYWNNGNDYHNVSRANPPALGGLEKSSCAANGYGCFANADCCNNDCANFVCGTGTGSGGSVSSSQPTVVITNPVNGSSYPVGSNVTVTATATSPNSTIQKVTFFYNGTPLGIATANGNTYSYAVTNVPAGNYTLTAVATDSNGVSVTSSPITSKAAVSTVTPTSSPVVSITSPANGSSFTAGSNITISATASETNGNISNVSFYYNGSNLLGTSSTPPYEYIATNVPAGSYTITAVATDANGISTTSNPISGTVTPPAVPSTPQSVPVVSITNPTSGSIFTEGSNVTINAIASESNGSIAKVTFYYNGNNLLGSTTQVPYQYVATSVPAGTYTVTAVATDKNGVSAASAPVSSTITPLQANVPVPAVKNQDYGSYTNPVSTTPTLPSVTAPAVSIVPTAAVVPAAAVVPTASAVVSTDSTNGVLFSSAQTSAALVTDPSTNIVSPAPVNINQNPVIRNVFSSNTDIFTDNNTTDSFNKTVSSTNSDNYDYSNNADILISSSSNQ